MSFLLALAIAANLLVGQDAGPGPTSAGSAPIQPDPKLKSSAEALLLMPGGKSTVIGGIISGVDPVRDQLTLKVFGGRLMKILFDERTLIYVDGVKMSLRDLHANEHASVETMLDGTAVFARSVHMLSQTPQGEAQGRVIEYFPATSELTVEDSLSKQPLRLQVPATAVFRRESQTQSADPSPGSPSDLIKGTLISVQFSSDNKGRGTVRQIDILAKPGAVFIIGGTVSFLDLRLHRLVVVDSTDNKSYELFFDSDRLPTAKDLHEGAIVKVTAEFKGSRYVADSIVTN